MFLLYEIVQTLCWILIRASLLTSTIICSFLCMYISVDAVSLDRGRLLTFDFVAIIILVI